MDLDAAADFGKQRDRQLAAEMFLKIGKPLQQPSPLFTKLDPALGETGPEWAPIVKE